MQFVAQKQVLNKKILRRIIKMEKKEMMFFFFYDTLINWKDDKSADRREIKYGQSASFIEIKSWSC